MSRVQAFDFNVGILRALLWQHNDAEHLQKIIYGKQGWFDANFSAFWLDWIRDVFDLRTANAFGCQVWATILGIKLAPAITPGDVSKPTFGFSDPDTINKNFTHGNFGANGANGVRLTVEQQRIVLRLRYFQLITRCTVTEINRFMRYIFGPLGKVYVLDPNDMSALTYVFDFEPDPQLAFILQEFDLLPRPSTVGVGYVVSSRPVFGFGDANLNFENGNFSNRAL